MSGSEVDVPRCDLIDCSFSVKTVSTRSTRSAIVRAITGASARISTSNWATTDLSISTEGTVNTKGTISSTITAIRTTRITSTSGVSTITRTIQGITSGDWAQGSDSGSERVASNSTREITTVSGRGRPGA